MNGIKEANKSQKDNARVPSGKMFWTAVAILALLLIFSFVILSVRLYMYSETDKRAVSLKADSVTDLNVFSLSYKNDSGDITIKGADGEKVLAPGAQVDYTVRIRNTDKIALDYELSPQVNLISQHELPILVRLIGPGEEYLVGDAKTWVPLLEMNSLRKTKTLLKNECDEYLFQWKWEFEAGNDEYDTWLGSNAVNQNIGVNINFSIHAQANTSAELNGGIFGENTDAIVLAVIFIILLITAIVLLVLSPKRRKVCEQGPSPEPVVIPTPAPISAEAPKKEPVVIPTPAPISAEAPKSEPVIVPIPAPISAEAPKKEPVVIPTPAPISAEAPKSEPRLKEFWGKMAIINLDVLQSSFEDGSVISLAILKEKGLISPKAKRMKVLARGSFLLMKSFIIETQAISAIAKAIVESAGGKVRITKG